jgi:hypothetical protein
VQKERLKIQRIEQDRIRKAVEERERQRVEQAIRENEERERLEIQKDIKEHEETRHRTSEGTRDTSTRTISIRKMHGRSALTNGQRRDKEKERKMANREEEVATDAIIQRTSSHPQPKASGKKAKPTVSFSHHQSSFIPLTWKYYKVNVGQMDELQKNKVRICIRQYEQLSY